MDELTLLKKENTILKKALSFYAAKECYSCDEDYMLYIDEGVAKKALQKVNELINNAYIDREK